MRELLEQDAEVVAPLILGWKLEREINGQKLVGKIVETEAYDFRDAASHSFRGETPRTKVMFGPAGFAYVYFTYGMHYCFNVVTGQKDEGSAVLIRALEPLKGIEAMRANRGQDNLLNLTNGPAKLCQALVIGKNMYGHDLRQAPLKLTMAENVPYKQVVRATRIGITNDTHRLWRFYIKNNKFISKA